MKKLTELFFAFAMTVTLFGLTACNEFSGGYVEQDESLTTNLTIEGLDGSFSGARTLFPASFEKDKLYYRLTGTMAESGKVLSDGTNNYIDFEADANGTASVNIAPAKWNLILTAYSDAGRTKEVLFGKQYIDLSNGGDTIKFTLKPHGNENGTVIFGKDATDGKFEVSFNAGTTLVAKYSIGLYDKDTDIAITGTTDDVAVTPPASTGTIFKKWENVKQGEYNLKVIFYNNEDKIINRYDELVIVAGGTTSEKDEDLTIVDFLTKPEAPSNLVAELAAAAVTDPKTKEENYNVVFTWNDNSSNEAGFALTLTEIATDGTEVADSIYTKTYTTADYNEIRFTDGNLSPNAKTATINLPTGHLFAASIKAVNETGDSDEVYATSATSFTSSVTVNTETPAAVGRFQVSYFMDGGTLTTDADTYTGTYYEHATYGTDITILELKEFGGDITSATQEKPFAYRAADSKTTTKIVDLKTGKTEYNAANANLTYSGIENLELKLSFETGIAITIYEFKDINKDRITLEFSEDGTTFAAAPASITKNGTLKITVDGTDTSGEAADQYADNKSISKFEVLYYKTTSSGTKKTGEVVLTENAGTKTGETTIDISTIDDGTYAFQIRAYDEKSAKWYDETIYTTINR